MYCVFLFRNASGRLPSAEELRALGFRVSGAAAANPGGAERPALARAAEAPAAYGKPGPKGTGK